MHELSICRNILTIINQHVIERKAVRVKKICLEIGTLSGIELSALQFGFDVVSKGSVAENAVLDIVTVQGKAYCDTCHASIDIQHYYDPCAGCGKCALTVTQGEELRVKYMEIE